MSAGNSRKRILFTGFEPFGPHKINPSWSIATALQGKVFSSPGSVATGNITNAETEYTVVSEKLPVVYSSVSTLVPQLIHKHSPSLVIHCGVGRPNRIAIEKRAHSSGYARRDNQGKHPQGGKIQFKDQNEEVFADVLETLVDVKEVAASSQKRVGTPKKSFLPLPCLPLGPIPITVSSDAGRYLCDYVYYLGLHNCTKRALRDQSFPNGLHQSVEILGTKIQIHECVSVASASGVPVLFIHVPPLGQWELETMVEAVTIIIEEVVQWIEKHEASVVKLDEPIVASETLKGDVVDNTEHASLAMPERDQTPQSSDAVHQTSTDKLDDSAKIQEELALSTASGDHLQKDSVALTNEMDPNTIDNVDKPTDEGVTQLDQTEKHTAEPQVGAGEDMKDAGVNENETDTQKKDESSSVPT